MYTFNSLGNALVICSCVYIAGVRGCACFNMLRGCDYNIWLWPYYLSFAGFRRCFLWFFLYSLQSGTTCMIFFLYLLGGISCWNLILYSLGFIVDPLVWIKFFIPFYFFMPVVYWVVVPRRIRRGFRANPPYYAPDGEAKDGASSQG